MVIACTATWAVLAWDAIRHPKPGHGTFDPTRLRKILSHLPFLRGSPQKERHTTVPEPLPGRALTQAGQRRVHQLTAWSQSPLRGWPRTAVLARRERGRLRIRLPRYEEISRPGPNTSELPRGTHQSEIDRSSAVHAVEPATRHRNG